MTGSTGHIKRRGCLFLLLFLLWIPALWLLLECIEAGRAFVAERAYQDYFEEQNRKVYRMVPAEEMEGGANAFIQREEHPVVAVKPPDDLHTGQTSAPLEDLELVLRGEMRARFNGRGELLESGGEPLIEQDLLRFLRGDEAHAPWAMFIDAIRAGTATLQTQCALTWGTPVHYAITLTRAGTAENLHYELIARDINEEMPLEALHYGDVPGPDSAWQTMFYRYKNDWSHPEDTLLQTNEFGFRDHTITVPKPENVYRIVCIGGSTTEEGNSTDATYPKMVERKLAERFGQGRIEVINAGICGTNTYNIRRRFQEYLDLEPDLVLFYGGINDTAHLHFRFWLNEVPQWKKMARHSFLLKRYFGFHLMPNPAYLQAYMRDTTFRNLRAMRHAARQRGAEMAWTSFAYPTLRWNDIKAGNYYDVNMRDVWQGQGYINFRTYCRIIDLFNWEGKSVALQEGIPWLPVGEHFHAGPDHFFDICHMTPLGLELKANIFSALLADYLKQVGIHPIE